jgi:phosphatidyl-myo-inositol dimannoside synthase
MKILFVTHNYYPFIGGVESQTRLIAHELAKKHELRVAAVNFGQKDNLTGDFPSWLKRRFQFGGLYSNLLAPDYNSYQDGKVAVHALTPTLSDRFRMLPISIRSLPLLQRYTYHLLNWFGFQWFKPVFQPKLLKLMQGVEVVHTIGASGYLLWAAQTAAQRSGIPCICTPCIHPGQYGTDRLSIEFYKRCQAVIALSEFERQQLIELEVPAKKIHVIGIAPDLPPVSDANSFRKTYDLEDKPIILFMGRMESYKGAKALLNATHQVWQSLPEANFIFIGPPSEESQEWFAKADDRIHYLGKVSHQEKANALAACDIFCMPSLFESFGAVYLEAWNYGKPVIGSIAPASRELIEGNDAGFCIDQEPSHISEAIVTLLQNPELNEYFGNQGRELVNRKYSVRAITRARESLYAQTINLQPSKGIDGDRQ